METTKKVDFYQILKDSAGKISDQKLTQLVNNLGQHLAQEDDKKSTHILDGYARASMAIARSPKLTKEVSRKGNRITQVWRPEAIHYQRVAAYAKDLYPRANDQGDDVIDAIFARLVEILA